VEAVQRIGHWRPIWLRPDVQIGPRPEPAVLISVLSALRRRPDLPTPLQSRQARSAAVEAHAFECQELCLLAAPPGAENASGPPQAPVPRNDIGTGLRPAIRFARPEEQPRRQKLLALEGVRLDGGAPRLPGL